MISIKYCAAKLQPLTDNLQKNLKSMEDFLNSEQYVDENMIPYFKKYFAKQFIQGKPCYVQKENICIYLISIWVKKKMKQSILLQILVYEEMLI